MALAACVAWLAGCTSQQLWRVGQQWQRQDCARLKDLDERQRCERSAATSYERYKAESDAASRVQKPPS